MGLTEDPVDLLPSFQRRTVVRVALSVRRFCLRSTQKRAPGEDADTTTGAFTRMRGETPGRYRRTARRCMTIR